MPYVKPERRKELDALPFTSEVGGDLNYIMSSHIVNAPSFLKATFIALFDAYWEQHDKRYVTINDIGGAVLNCAMEFNRRGKVTNNYRWGVRCMAEAYVDWYNAVAGLYEDSKLAENGDIFP